MKMTKRIIPFVLSLLLLSLSMATFANADASCPLLFASVPGQESGDVKVDYTPTTPGAIVYSVDVAWGALKFDYNGGSIGTWDVDQHQYVNPVAASWTYTPGTNLVTVKNHSNASVDVTLSYTPNSTYNAVVGAFSGDGIVNNEATLASAEVTEPSTPPTVVAALTLSGEMPDGDAATNLTIGSVTVAIAAA